ncbi:MAG TPA: isochorismatase family cysteine hydrolase [Thermoleophilaceae bacterium]|nr:isochorismatase family cysteine hydrolase [Thermoleophilaceae bacterium]
MAGTALIVVDMLNPYDHEDADKLIESVEQTIDPIRRLLDRAAGEDVDVIYVNDNYNDWNSSEEELARRALDGRRGDLVEPILPPEDASFVIKARHSIFYGTPLEHLLHERELDHLVLCGQVTEQCILYSALDAYVRRFSVGVASDAVAHIDRSLADAALKMMERNMRAEIAPAAACDLTVTAAT